jgi:hypothetical protein
MSVKYTSIYVTKDLSNIDDLFEVFSNSVDLAISRLSNINLNDGKVIWNVNGPLLMDKNCLSSEDIGVSANRYHTCVGCKILQQLDFRKELKNYRIGFGSLYGMTLSLITHEMVLPNIKILSNGKELGSLIIQSIGSCSMNYSSPSIMVGLDKFTNNILISHILSKMSKHVLKPLFVYICNNNGYTIVPKTISIDRYISSHPHQAGNIFNQLIQFYQDCRKNHLHFTHGSPSMDSLTIEETDSGPVLKISNFEYGSVNAENVRIHALATSPDIHKLKSILKFDELTKSYQFLFNNKTAIHNLHCAGIPIFNESYDLYHFIMQLSKISQFNAYFNHAGIYAKVFSEVDHKTFMSSKTLVGLNLYCNVLDRL